MLARNDLDPHEHEHQRLAHARHQVHPVFHRVVGRPAEICAYVAPHGHARKDGSIESGRGHAVVEIVDRLDAIIRSLKTELKNGTSSSKTACI